MKYVGDTIVFPEHQNDGSGYKIPIPSYHRAAVGIFPGTKLFLLPVPKTRDLIVTPIEPKKWGDLWKLEVSLKDTPGAARSIVETLVKNKVNILIQEGLSDYAYSGVLAHRVLFVLDLADYHSDIDGNTQHRNTVEKPSLTPNQLITNILAGSVDYLLPTPAEDRWDFTFGKMEFFYRNKEHRTGSDKTHLIDRAIMVPDRIVHTDIYGGGAPPKVACHMISDTEEKYIKVRFLDPKVKYILLRIEHKERVGAILGFMNVLKRKEANIINSYSRLASMSQLAVWCAFSEVPVTFVEQDVGELLEELSQLDDVDSFTVLGHFGFPPDFDLANYAESRGLRHYQPLIKTPAAEMAPFLDLSEELQRTEKLLGMNPFYQGKEWVPEPDNVFIAMPFDKQYEEFYDQHIKEGIEGCGLRAVRIDKTSIPDPNVLIMELVKKHIATCRFVVADVSGHNPNVLYEVGLAHAVGRPVLFLCEEKYKKKGLLFDLSGHLHLFYSPYKTRSFSDEFRRRIRDMRNAPPQPSEAGKRS